jgi:hypothetical protein
MRKTPDFIANKGKSGLMEAFVFALRRRLVWFPCDRLTHATPASRKIRANDAVDGTGLMPNARIFSCTLIGP